MKTMKYLLLAAPVALCANVYAGSQGHWGYEGKEGPQNWGKLSKEFTTCDAGMRQSPVNIDESIAADLARITFNYAAAPVKVVNNGHTIQVNSDGKSSIKLGSNTYKLLQYHFHSPSENKIGNKPFDMEMHLVHQNEAGELAVVGVMLKAGGDNDTLAPIWKAMPKEVNKEKTLTAKVNAEDILPKKQQFYHFKGSLTTPPCSEGVEWFVMKEPVQVSKKQVEKFVALIGHNARPIQAANGRFILNNN